MDQQGLRVLFRGIVERKRLLQHADHQVVRPDVDQILVRQSGLLTSLRRLNRGHPQRAVEARGQVLDDLRERLKVSASKSLQGWRAYLEGWGRRSMAVRPRALLNRVRESLSSLERRQDVAADTLLTAHRSNLRRLKDTLRLLSPDRVIERGYSLTQDPLTGEVLRRSDQVQPGRRVRTRLAHGSIESVVVPPQSDSAT